MINDVISLMLGLIITYSILIIYTKLHDYSIRRLEQIEYNQYIIRSEQERLKEQQEFKQLLESYTDKDGELFYLKCSRRLLPRRYRQGGGELSNSIKY